MNSIWGYVSDHRSNPVAGAVVTEGSNSVITNSDGYYEIVDETYVARNSFTVRASWTRNDRTCLSEKVISYPVGSIRREGTWAHFSLTCFGAYSLTISTDLAESLTGTQVRVSVSAFDYFGDLIPYPDVWFSAYGTGGESPSYGYGEANGTGSTFDFTSYAAGESRVTASIDYAYGEIFILWLEGPPPPPPPPPPPTPTSLQLSPTTAELNVGSTHTLTAYATDSNDQPLPDGTWISFAIDGPEGGVNSGFSIVGIAPGPDGYWLVTDEGRIFNFGVGFWGDLTVQQLAYPIVGMAATPSGNGYWLAASNGGIFAFGDAAFHGSTGGMQLNAPIVGMAGTPSGNGYWLVASDGGVFTFGDAEFYGSMGGVPLNEPVVGMARTPSGNGYWLVASDGGIFTFGDAAFLGSTGGFILNNPMVGMAATSSGNGYWLVASDGGIFAFGDAAFWGSTGGSGLTAPMVGIFGGDAGYTLGGGDGQVWTFGSNEFAGSLYASQTDAGTATFYFTSSVAGFSQVRGRIEVVGYFVTATAEVTWVAI